MHHHFTLAAQAHEPGGNLLLCGPLPAGHPTPGITRRLALGSADFPRRTERENLTLPRHDAIARPTWAPGWSVMVRSNPVKAKECSSEQNGWAKLKSSDPHLSSCSRGLPRVDFSPDSRFTPIPFALPSSRTLCAKVHGLGRAISLEKVVQVQAEMVSNPRVRVPR